LEKTRRFAETVLRRHPEAFSTDYEKNKKSLEDLALIPSKQLRNQIAGYIAKSLRQEEAETEEVVEEAKAE
jgi:small subunit ribosomal protein S17e